MNGRIVALFLVALCCALMVNEVSSSVGPQCLMPLERGPCRALMKRYGYNPETNRCEEFFFGGCQGNANNFMNLDMCKESCS
ncbi:kunitz-type serine protease inhibitor Bt-KTI-like [Osmia bicornis bicornis]|uniref:kunitz-type serine protease inhibitor Bt-KTI-like n=1 Tax=Osmia bicornis bicornis TaxID=1437191 RepID=UPI0010F6FCF3|nr:kunitz-type serine protease inhibitor Bt-KTI-like [Osmia bicornis bicornis]